jgi:hypothetical protein
MFLTKKKYKKKNCFTMIAKLIREGESERKEKKWKSEGRVKGKKLEKVVYLKKV